MSCCGDAELKGGWNKAVASEQLCFRFIKTQRPVYMEDTVVPPGDYIVRCPAFDLTFRVGAAEFDKFFEPLMQEKA